MADLLALRDRILARLRAEPNWTVYDGAVPDRVPVDPSGRALAYAVLYMSPAWADATQENLCADPGLERLTWQVTVASGYVTTTLHAATKADRALLGWSLPGHGVVRRDPSMSVAEDRDVTPSRHWLPLTYRVDLG